MDAKEAIAVAKKYVNEIYADEQLTSFDVEEIEHLQNNGAWAITIGFSRPWNTPRTRAQEVLENLGAFSPLKRSFKIITITDDGSVLSMKNRLRQDIAE